MVTRCSRKAGSISPAECVAIQDAAACRDIRAQTAGVLKLANV
jgi:hypothetical protein